jgi:hypothetical protein
MTGLRPLDPCFGLATHARQHAASVFSVFSVVRNPVAAALRA